MNAEHDDDTRAPLDDAEALALLGLPADALPSRVPSRGGRERLLAALRGPERFAPFLAEVSRAFGLGEAALRAAFARIPDEAAWQPGFWPGSQLLSTPELAQAHTVFARLAAGSRIASHGHPMRELTYVLDGLLYHVGETFNAYIPVRVRSVAVIVPCLFGQSP